jgi:hypothetical protein
LLNKPKTTESNKKSTILLSFIISEPTAQMDVHDQKVDSSMPAKSNVLGMPQVKG